MTRSTASALDELLSETIQNPGADTPYKHNLITILADIAGDGYPNFNRALYQCQTPEQLLSTICTWPGFSEQALQRLQNALAQNPANMISPNPPEYQVLSDADLTQWREQGYVIIRNIVSREEANNIANHVLDTLQMSLDNEDSWYSSGTNSIMREYYHHPLLDLTRQSERAKAAFAQLWQQEELWISKDRVSFNPPENQHYQFKGPHLHLDVNFNYPLHFDTQGIVYLNDVAENQGTLTVCPGFHQQYRQWLANVPSGTNPNTVDFYQFPTKAIAANAGDLIIWHHWLPHGSSPNRHKLPRLAQYLNMKPLKPHLVDKTSSGVLPI